MNKKQFEENKEPLALIVSFDPETGKSIFDTYNWSERDYWMSVFEKDFPKLIHFSTLNKSAINERKETQSK